ncbi:hypothetical protein Hanom_Chr04g00358951 [Helianthus anomalus]
MDFDTVTFRVVKGSRANLTRKGGYCWNSWVPKKVGVVALMERLSTFAVTNDFIVCEIGDLKVISSKCENGNFKNLQNDFIVCEIGDNSPSPQH